MASLNKVMVIGNAGRDAEVRYTTSGMAVASVSLAINYKLKGEEQTEWVNCTFWDKLAEVAGEYIKKGKPVFVEGRLQTRKYTDKDGVERYATEVVAQNMQLLGSRDDHERPAGPRGAAPEGRPARQQKPSTGFDDMDDDVPF